MLLFFKHTPGVECFIDKNDLYTRYDAVRRDIHPNETKIRCKIGEHEEVFDLRYLDVERTFGKDYIDK